ncbi:MAG: transcription initiation factor IIB [Candidatus Marsarchaeota archaeon]|jgi:transcription initiation factor TFIIB|nr:transcription initiation factor IIB [Candidatus Marsarchaeota archaeon]
MSIRNKSIAKSKAKKAINKKKKGVEVEEKKIIKKIILTPNKKINVEIVNTNNIHHTSSDHNQVQSSYQPHYEEKTSEKLKICPSCGSTNIIRDNERGELICNSCGLIIEENMADTGPEWRAFDTEQRNAKSRTGAPMKYTKSNKGLVTEIDLYNKDIRGVKIPSKRQAQLYRMRKWHKRASIASSSERNYLIALPELNRVASYLGLPENIRESAALLYRKCVQSNLIRGRPIETVVQAVIYAACREAGTPRTLDEIANISGMPKKEIGRAYRVISHELNLKIPLTDPQSYVPRYINALKLSGEAQEKSYVILKDAMKKGLVSGRSPTGVSAAAVYIASALTGERRTQKEVADVAGVTEVTIRNRYRELKDRLNIDVNL